ncbi:MAG: glutamyl-tRNA reductase [Planctomycetota bacterium]|nr:glutamyl-tRNA reductase [Planctomycetota bacterium]
MELIVFGLNHKTAPVGIRERWSLSSGESEQALERISSEIADSEHLILSTCNRTEFYSVIPASSGLARNLNEEDDAFRQLTSFYLGEDNVNSGGDDHFYLHRQENAVKHLFRVAGGLDSMIIGETEILRPLKEAYALSEKNSASGKMFRRLFPEALKVGKKVRTSTSISEGCITPGQAALRLASEVLGNLEGKEALLIGSGVVAGLTARAFIEHDLRKFTVVNRTTESAEAMLEEIKPETGELQARVIALGDDLPDAITSAELVISSTSSVEPILTAETLREIQKQRDSRPLVIIDLAVPRDIEPRSGELENLHLFNIDDLNSVIQGNLSSRHEQFSKAEEIVNKQIDIFYSQLNYLEVDPVIRHLIERFEIIRRGELQNTLESFPPEQHEAVDKLTRSLVNKLIYFPIERLKSIRDMQGLSEDETAFLKKLFLPK